MSTRREGFEDAVYIQIDENRRNPGNDMIMKIQACNQCRK